MAQGTQVTRNLLHNNLDEDLFCEVDHGPFLVANNLFLSHRALLVVSQGGAYAHNLIAGNMVVNPFDGRLTPFHKAHSTELGGLHDNPNGDVRYYNNLFVDRGDLSSYNKPTLPVWMAGNVFLKGATTCTQEKEPLLKPDFDPTLKLDQEKDGFYLEITLDKSWAKERKRSIVTTGLLGQAAIPNLPFENADGSPIRLNTDYFGIKRTAGNPFPGPFEIPKGGRLRLKVW
jgi:alpha-N-arabinofuranosidase